MNMKNADAAMSANVVIAMLTKNVPAATTAKNRAMTMMLKS
jgi:hypothetical protein